MNAGNTDAMLMNMTFHPQIDGRGGGVASPTGFANLSSGPVSFCTPLVNGCPLDAGRCFLLRKSDEVSPAAESQKWGEEVPLGLAERRHRTGPNLLPSRRGQGALPGRLAEDDGDRCYDQSDDHLRDTNDDEHATGL